MTTNIEYVPYGLANRYDNVIELNENLKNYPELHDSILAHEMAHTNESGFTKEDFLLDFGEHKINYWKLGKFMFKNPKTFLQLAPIYRVKGTFFYDINMIIYWSLILTAVGIGIAISF